MTARESAIYAQFQDLGYSQGMILTAMKILSQSNKSELSLLAKRKNTKKIRL